ncbi:MAG: Bacterial regulatory protein luxR family [Candidatus Eremiobacteraeota bacterium]|jgi:DNA-binding CsgD family transcriptional regulator|nr:Bacterial regulatory protein luxR family [Candidatus Eremiobacteraeota bacterium]
MLDGARLDRREDRVAGALLQARALLAVDRPEEVSPLLQRAGKEAKGAEETALANMLAGAALTRTNRRDKGESLLDEAAALAEKSAPQHVAEIAYYRALSRWSSFRLPEAEEIVDAALPGARDIVRARLLQLLGWIDVRRENYGAAAHEFTAALDELNKAKHTDVKGRAKVLLALAVIAAETIDVRLGRLVRREYETTAWSDDVRIERFRVLEYLSWLSLLEGEVARAWDERQLALMLTVDSSHHAVALVDAAIVAGIVGDRFSESRYLELAGALLLRGDQVNLDVDRRLAMLAFAATVPSANVDAARKVLTLYERTRPRRAEMSAFEGDRRLDAYELYARGKVAIAEGSTQQGVADLEQSLELWTRLGYRLRIATTANVLRSVTGDRRFAQTALDALRNTPNAWLREALERRTNEDDPLGQLTPAERRVLAELCKGRKAREIAATFDRSFNTINNHTRAIFSAFGVRSRASLVAECARLGILDDVKSLR